MDWLHNVPAWGSIIAMALGVGLALTVKAMWPGPVSVRRHVIGAAIFLALFGSLFAYVFLTLPG